MHLLDNVDMIPNQRLVDLMRELVPEYNSTNSYYTNGSIKIESSKKIS